MLKSQRITGIAAIATLSALAFPAWSASIGLDELPASVALQLQNGAVQMDVANGRIESRVSYTGFNAYAMTRGVDDYWLVQYDLVAGSHFNDGPSAELGGSVFLEVPNFWSPTFPDADITMHFDQLIPDIGGQLFLNGSTQVLTSVDSAALIGGSANNMLSGDPDYIVSGTMRFVSDVPFICIECAFAAELNFVYLDYSNFVLEFDFDDARPNLFTAVDTFDTTPYNYDLNLAVQPVPVPAALPMFIWAMTALTFICRRNPRIG